MKNKSIRIHRPTLVCFECKKRKLKCDKQRPNCTRCRQNHLICFYGDNSTFNQDDTESSASTEIASKRTPDNQEEVEAANGRTGNQTSSTTSEQCSDVTFSLCSPKDMLVIRGSTTFLDYPFSLHSLVQHDQYTRALGGSLHGITLLDLSNHRSGQPDKETSQRLHGPLPFLEKAIFKCMENSRLAGTQHSLTGFSLRSLEDEGSMIALQALVDELESLLVSKSESNDLLKKFYAEIFPFYAFMDISIFEDNLASLFVTDEANRLKINLSGNDLRRRIETLSLFLTIISMGLKSLTSSKSFNSSAKENHSLLAEQLSAFSYKLIELLNVFHYTNEGGFTCLLYYFISRYINPKSPDIFPAHASFLNIKQLTGLAVTLGLQHDPSQYMRYRDPRALASRRALWRGVQSLAFQIALPDGGSDTVNRENMQIFLRGLQGPHAFSEDVTSVTAQLRMSLCETSDDKYQFHLQLSKLISVCAPTSGITQLHKILVNINRSEEFMYQAFPLYKTSNALTDEDLNMLELERGALVNIELIKRTENLLCNLAGHLCILNVYDMLSLYFENNSNSDWDENDSRFRKLTLQSFVAYLNLSSVISDYLTGRLGDIRQSYGYAVDQHVCFLLVRIWIYQCRFLLRLSYKQSIMQQQFKNAELNGIQEEDSKYNNLSDVLTRNIKYLRNQMTTLIDLAENAYGDSYLSSYSAVSMFKYIVHIVDQGNLNIMTNAFWQLRLQGKYSPRSIIEEVYLKWGLDSENSRSILHKLKGPQALIGFSYDLMVQVENAVLSHKFEGYLEIPTKKRIAAEPIDESEEDVFSGILGSNIEAFWEFLIDDSKGFP
ncbi:LANO_0E16820g1_1 [Lachancea nothofagi CBS 11611]|uniref:LANO_0E16820g1_1 n=1 Tax=Lachancea nothofagi CBS 11611 TaxID=1266666 RepID=A0A1G4K2I4_9SACH|nr:LANO_0E16820g1_1 [Lachancea nothofagi CBS 11611]